VNDSSPEGVPYKPNFFCGSVLVVFDLTSTPPWGPLAFLNSKSPRIVCHQSTDSTPFVLILTQRAPVFAAGEHALYASMQ